MIIEKLLRHDVLYGSTCAVMDSPFVPGVIASPLGRKGTGRLRRICHYRWTPNPEREWDSTSDLHKALARALVTAAAQNSGRKRLVSWEASGIDYFLGHNPEEVKAVVMHPKEAEAWGYVPGEKPDDPWTSDRPKSYLILPKHPGSVKPKPEYTPVYAMKEMPQRAILGLAGPEYVGVYTVRDHRGYGGMVPPKGTVQGEFAINPLYVLGFRRTGKIREP